MGWSFTLGRLFGIPIRVHLTFLLLLLFVAAGLFGFGRAGGLYGVILVLATFTCVVVHELAHSLVAMRLGIPVRSITLYPLGGVARMDRIPKKPLHEIAIAAVGPAASFALAALAYLWYRRTVPAFVPLGWGLSRGSIPAYLVAVNFMLGAFNLLPAFPLDGGRVFRGLLGLRISFERATWIAVSLGQFLAVVLFVYGIFGNQKWLALIAVIIYLGAEGEERMTLALAHTEPTPVNRAMVSPVAAIAPATRIGDLVDRVLHGYQQDFPVVDGGRLVGMLPGDRILEIAGRGDLQVSAGESMIRDHPVADPFDDLDEIASRLDRERLRAMPVAADGSLIGMITPGQIARYDRWCELGGDPA